MERADIQVETIVIEARKAEYILREHGVLTKDVAEVHGNAPRYFLFDARNGIYDIIGPNRAGRFLVVGIQHVSGAEWRLVTAYWNTDGRAEEVYNEG